MSENKTYFLYGYTIKRKPHYVNAYQHYIYLVDLDGNKVECESLNGAKNAIRKHLGIK